MTFRKFSLFYKRALLAASLRKASDIGEVERA
jgi:hypothetical protein